MYEPSRGFQGCRLLYFVTMLGQNVVVDVYHRLRCFSLRLVTAPVLPSFVQPLFILLFGPLLRSFRFPFTRLRCKEVEQHIILNGYTPTRIFRRIIYGESGKYNELFVLFGVRDSCAPCLQEVSYLLLVSLVFHANHGRYDGNRARVVDLVASVWCSVLYISSMCD